MSEPRDRILELALEEELAGTTPPDMSERIRWRLAQNQHRQSQIGLVRGSPRRSSATWAGSLMGAAAALALVFWIEIMTAAQPQPALGITVAEGSVRWQSAGTSREFSEPNTYTVFPVLGDRLESSTEELALMRLADLGTLEMSPGCTLEIEEMTFNEFGKGFVVGAAVVAVVAGTVHFVSGDYAVKAEAGDRLTMHQGERLTALGDPISTDGLQQEISDLRVVNQRLSETLARRRAELPQQEELAEEQPEGLEVAAVITYADFAKSLDGMDWGQMGSAAKDMVPKLQELMKALQNGEDPPIDLAGEIQQLNGQLLANLGGLQDGQIPGTGINGAFTHPVFAANLMNATLAAAGVALDEGQLRVLQDLTNRFAGEDDSRIGSYGSDVPAIQKLIEEIGLRSRFYEQAKASMSPEQRAALGSGPEGPGPMDLFSGDPAWQQFTKPVRVDNRADFTSRLTGNLLHGLKLDATQDAAQITKLTQMIDAWAEAAPESYFGRSASGLVNAKAFPSAGVTAAAQYQAQLFRNMISNLDLSPGQRQVLLKNRGVFIPISKGK